MQSGPEISTRPRPLVLLAHGRAEEQQYMRYRPCLNLAMRAPTAAVSEKASIIASASPSGAVGKLWVSGIPVAKCASVICFHTRKSPVPKASRSFDAFV
jgi:hypothetical protein